MKARSNMIRFFSLVIPVLIVSLAVTAITWAQQATTTTNAAATAPKQESLTRLWVGEEMWQFGGKRHQGDPAKSWRLIPGSRLELQYSGAGPLPKPVEYVIQLDNEPLPLSRVYYLSVKNWYVGTMEATLGDITRKLETPRYDWTPIVRFEPNERVDRIVLRYFPSTIVADTGKEQSQQYVVQGVFLSTEPTQVPFEGGQIISLLEQKAPTMREGNYFDNGSFETGLYPWGPAFEISGGKVIDRDNLDASTAAHGRHSVKITATSNSQFGLNNKMYALSPGEYTLSFYAKADKKVNLRADINGLHTSLKDYEHTDVRNTFKLSTEWTRYSVTGEIKEMPGFLYTADFRGDVKEPTNIWIDAIQLENGAMTDYRSSRSIEVGYISSMPGHIYYRGGEAATVDLLLHNTAGPSQPTVEYKVENYWGTQVDQGSKVIDLPGEHTRLSLPLFDKSTGIFRILFTAGDAQAEMVYSVVPPNPHLTSKYYEGTLATDAHLHDPKALAILKRANFNWVLEKQLARWYVVEEKENQYQFFDAEIKNAEDAHLNVVLQLFNMRPHYRQQAWLAPLVVETTGGKSVREPGIWREDKRDAFFQQWSEYVFTTVDHYKGSVKHWEIFNEPNSELGAKSEGGEQYGHALKATAEAIRRADPQAKVVGFAGGGFNREFYDAGLKAAGADSAAVLSVHFYGGAEKPFGEYADMLEHYKKPGWNTETGTSCPTFFSTLPGFEALQQAGYEQHALRDVHAQTQSSVKNYLQSLSVGRMDKWFNYFARFTNASPSQPTRWAGNGKEITEYDGSLRGNGVGLTIASHFIDGATYQGPAPMDERLEAHLFQKGDKSVGFLWGVAGQALTLSAAKGLTFYDIMGARIEDQSLQVAESPIYFTFEGDANSGRALLTELKITSGK